MFECVGAASSLLNLRNAPGNECKKEEVVKTWWLEGNKSEIEKGMARCAARFIMRKVRDKSLALGIRSVSIVFYISRGPTAVVMLAYVPFAGSDTAQRKLATVPVGSRSPPL